MFAWLIVTLIACPLIVNISTCDFQHFRICIRRLYLFLASRLVSSGPVGGPSSFWNHFTKALHEYSLSSQCYTATAHSTVCANLTHRTHFIVLSQYLQSYGDDVYSCMRSPLMCVLVFIFDLCNCSPLLIVKWFLPDRRDEWSTSLTKSQRNSL